MQFIRLIVEVISAQQVWPKSFLIWTRLSLLITSHSSIFSGLSPFILKEKHFLTCLSECLKLKYRQINRICPQRCIPSKNGGPPLEFINIQPPKMGSTSRIHQRTASQKVVRLQISSTYSPPKGGLPLEFINIKPPKGGPPLEFINIQPPKRGPPLEFINQRGSASRFHQPKGVHLQISSTKKGSHQPKRWSASGDNFYGSSGPCVNLYLQNPYWAPHNYKPRMGPLDLEFLAKNRQFPSSYAYLSHQNYMGPGNFHTWGCKPS